MERLVIADIELYISPFKYVDANMYLMMEGDKAVLIDPHKDEELTHFLLMRRVKSLIILLTHEHHDHTSGIYWYQKNFESRLICQIEAAKAMASRRYLHPMVISYILGENDRKNGSHLLYDFKQSYEMRNYYADMTFDEELLMDWSGHQFQFYHIPGHSKGSALVIIDDKVAFTGDSLLCDMPVITRFPGSNHIQFVNKSLPLLRENLKDYHRVLPGHGKTFVFGEILNKGQLNVQFR